jgi:hypothetical protein
VLRGGDALVLLPRAAVAAVARAGALVLAARMPPQHSGWIQTSEGLWLPATYLLPVSGGRVSPEEAAAAHAEHEREAAAAFGDEAGGGASGGGGGDQLPPAAAAPAAAVAGGAGAASPAGGGGGGGGSQPGWFRVDPGGAVAFRSAPRMEALTRAAARAEELIFVSRLPPEHPAWAQTEEGLWLPRRFLLKAEPLPSAAEQEAARTVHETAAE